MGKTYPEINDIALTAAKRDGEIGYSLRVGGGLSNEPHLAVPLNVFVRPDQAVRVVRAVTEIFRDQTVLRESRDRARLKYLFMKEGWTAESFLAELQSRLDFPLRPAVPEIVPEDVYRDHAGIHRQRQQGLSYVGASVLRGRKLVAAKPPSGSATTAFSPIGSGAIEQPIQARVGGFERASSSNTSIDSLVP